LNIVYFLTYGYSLETWSSSSALEREVRYFNYLSKNYGYKFHIVTYGNNEDTKFSDYFINATILPIGSITKIPKNKYLGFIKSFYYPFKIKKHINEKSNIVKQNQLLGSWVSIIFKYITNSKLFVRTGYDMYLFSKKENKKFLKILAYKLLTRLTIKFSDRYTVSSTSDMSFLEGNFNSQTKAHLLHNWVESFEVGKISDRESTIISVGRLEYQKNYEFLIKELSNLRLELQIVGEGSRKDELINLAKKFNTNLQITQRIDNKELTRKFMNIKLFVISSHFEGNPKVLLEAMAAGCIVFASNIKNHSEIIDEGINGFLFELEENSFRNKILEIIQSMEEASDFLEKVSHSATQKIKTKYSLPIIAEEENRLLLELASE
jgi:glycosyltransferase involved in cell wall biosynthesis